jgi:Glycosyl transferases group 1
MSESIPCDLHFVLDSEFFHNQTGIGQDAQPILQAIRNRWTTSESNFLPYLPFNGRWKRKCLTLIWFLTFGRIHASGPPNSIFYQSQVSLLKPPKHAKDWVIRVHDLFPITNPEWFHIWDRFIFKRSLDSALKSGAGFIANSESTKVALLDYAKLPIRVELIPCAIRKLESPLCTLCAGCHRINELQNYEFVTAVGTLEPRKNYIELIKIWERRKSSNHKLIIVGKVGWKSKKIRSAIAKSQNTVYLNNCCDGALDRIFAISSSFISISLAEGFNMPAMEARQLYNLPLVLSDIAVHREFHADCAYFITTPKDILHIDFTNLSRTKKSNYYVNVEYVDTLLNLIHKSS